MENSHLLGLQPRMSPLNDAIPASPPPAKKKSRRGGDSAAQKRRCVSTACIACRRRKSKCDGALPSCAACASVYGTECVYDPNSDHRRKGVYKEKIDSMKARSSTLQILIEAILNADEEDVPDIVKRIRTCDSLDNMAETLLKEEELGSQETDHPNQYEEEYPTDMPVEGERDLAQKMGELRLENGSTRFIGGTSHLIHWDSMGSPSDELEAEDAGLADVDPITSWSGVTKDPKLVIHLLNMYFCWHYPYFTTLSRALFHRDFIRGKHNVGHNKTAYCSSLLVNAMLALGCHFTSVAGAYATMGDSWTKGDHFFSEAKRLIVEHDEYEKPRLATVQALALMSVREAGCGREAKGWVYSGMSFRMAQDLGLNMDLGKSDNENLDEKEIDARRVTFWGCFLFDKCWSNYLGRLPQLPKNSYSVPKYDVFPDEDAEAWCPYTDAGFDESSSQPCRTRTIGLQLSRLCEISSDLLIFFYHPAHIGRSSGKSVELKKLSELHRRLEDWRRELPRELEAKEGQLPNAILMHMFFHLQYIHLFRPFLKYSPHSSPLPTHVSPRRICTANAGAISKLMRLYKKLYDLRQICNIAVYMIHSACTIHLLNLPEKTAKRDIIHGVRHLEEIAEDWVCGRRTLSIISVLARKWNVELPEEASQVLQRTDERWGTFNTSDVPTPRSLPTSSPSPPDYAAASPPAFGAASPPAFPAASPPAVGGFSPQPKPETYSPVNPNRAQIPPASVHGVRNPRASPEVTKTLAASAGNFQPSLPLQGQMLGNVSAMDNSFNMTFEGLDTAGWRAPAVTDTMPNYSQQYAAMTNVARSESASVVGTRRTTPSSAHAIDGQDWYLKDGANWQSSFDAWNLGGGAGAGGGAGNISDSSLFLFASNAHHPAQNTRASPPVMDFNFDSLANLSSIDDWDLRNFE